MKNHKLFQNKIKQPTAFARNSKSSLHRSQLSHQGPAASFHSVLMQDNRVTIQGQSVMNSRSAFQNPFKDQLDLDSRDLIKALLEKNRHHNLSEFQKKQLKHLRNQSVRSKLIVFGDCVDQLESMVDKRQNLFKSTQEFRRTDL